MEKRREWKIVKNKEDWKVIRPWAPEQLHPKAAKEWKPRYKEGDLDLAKKLFEKHWDRLKKINDREEDRINYRIDEFSNLLLTLAGDKKGAWVQDPEGIYHKFLKEHGVPHLMHSLEISPEGRKVIKMEEEELKAREQMNDFEGVMGRGDARLYVLPPKKENAEKILNDFVDEYNKAAGPQERGSNTDKQHEICHDFLGFTEEGGMAEYPHNWLEKRKGVPEERAKHIENQTALLEKHFKPLYEVFRKQYSKEAAISDLMDDFPDFTNFSIRKKDGQMEIHLTKKNS